MMSANISVSAVDGTETHKEPFGQFERLNALIDVWIDEEEFDAIFGDEERPGALRLSANAAKSFDECFAHPSCTYEYGAQNAWDALIRRLSTASTDELLALFDPDAEVCRIVRNGGLDQDVLGSWLRLLLVKLVRARIQQKGTDCYFVRLDQLIVLLENHLPGPQRDNLVRTRLSVLYLLEASSSAVRFEQLGFADRAHRILVEYLPSSDLFGEYYDLWARFDLGVGHFHQSRYRQAVLEFNYIIREITSVLRNGDQDRREYYHYRLGTKLLLVPAVFFRAMVQLKLQLAYHAASTLREYGSYWERGQGLVSVRSTARNLKAIRARLIEAEAFQQMGMAKEGWDCLSDLCQCLFDRQLGGIEECLAWTVQIGEKWQNAKGQLLTLLIDHHLTELVGSENDSPKYVDLVYLRKLADVLQHQYRTVRHISSNRSGFYEQLAQYLKYLCAPQIAERMGANGTALVMEVYRSYREGLLEEEELQIHECRYCSQQGISLLRLKSEHYEQFSDNLLEFFSRVRDLPGLSQDLRVDEKRFIERLIRREERNRENLRVRKTQLKYQLEDADGKWAPECSPCSIDETAGAFSCLLACQPNGTSHKPDYLPQTHYEQIMSRWDEHFLDHLEKRSRHEVKGFGSMRATALRFEGLQRWNSSSPAQGRSVGGGYLVYHTDTNGVVDLGIAIDPGFDYIRNLFRMGFSLQDIDIVLISHSHIDHCRDFESMIILLQELRKRRGVVKRLHVIFTLGVYRKLQHVIESPAFREFIEPYIIDIGKEIHQDYFESLPSGIVFRFEPVFGLQSPDSSGAAREEHDALIRGARYRALLEGEAVSGKRLSVEIRPTQAFHEDHSGYSDSFGFMIVVNPPSGRSITLGYTGDTKWVPDVVNQYRDCDTLLVHLGSLIKPRKGKAGREYRFDRYKVPRECETLIREANHPYLMGALRFLGQASRIIVRKEHKPLVMLSEFGEELRGGIRVDLIRRLKDAYRTYLDFIPVDVGTSVLLRLWPEGESTRLPDGIGANPYVRCAICDEFVPLEMVEFDRYGEDEALYCVCSTCERGVPAHIRQDRLKRLYEVGHELEAAYALGHH
jgi:ribonuclease BN (tRNA processing enzyme)